MSKTQSGSKGSRGGSPDDPMALKSKITMLEEDLKRRQQNYILRERSHMAKIEELEEEIGNYRKAKTGWMSTDAKSNRLKQFQEQILENVEMVQERTGKILQEQERDLLRAFRARLFDIQSELERERGKKDEGADEWVERGRQLEAELEWSKEVSDRLERVNQALTTENNRLKGQNQSQEEDRNFMINQLVAVKKENARFRLEFASLESENKTLVEKVRKLEDQTSRRDFNIGKQPMTKPETAATDERYKDLNSRLNRLLTEERKNLHQVRQNYALELRTRTEMELLLRQCVDDVRREINKTQLITPGPSFSVEDRTRVVETLLSKEKVVSLLYAKTFPITLRSGGLAIQGEKQEGTAANLSGFDALDGEKSITLPSIVSGSSPSTK